MSRRIACFLAVLLACALLPRLQAQSHNDPLTEDEVQQIRDNAIHPDERIRLYIKFMGQRLDAIHQLLADQDASDRSAQIRARLEEFTSLCDEVQDNLDTYDSAHADIRKSLKELVAASAKWPDVLNALPPNQKYEFPQKTALEAAQSAIDEAKQMSTEQDVYFDVHKKQRHSNGTAPS
ncbi:MAG TPA: hypothetical protein VIY53_09870 [Acidobacteriaceae bacterium]